MIGELTNHLWQSTLFAVAAGLMAVALRKNRAHIRYWLWLSASLKFLVPFALLISLGSHLQWAPRAKTTATQAISFTMVQITTPFPDTVSLAPSAPSTTYWPLIAILSVWVGGFTVIALIRFRDWRSIRTAVRASTRLDIPVTLEVRSSAIPLEPGVVGLDVFGFSRPVLLLPAGIIERLTQPQLQTVLAHEACHVRRRDNLTAALHMLVEAIFWFHPLVWWIGARLIAEREQACDEAVLRQGNDAHVYAGSILSVCKFYVESPVTFVSGVTGADLKMRVARIMRNDIGASLSSWKKLVLATAGAVAVAAPLAAGVLIYPRPQAQSDAAPQRVIGAGPLHFRYFFQDHKPQTAPQGAAALGVPSTSGALTSLRPQAQTPLAAPVVPAKFDTASIKPNKSGDQRVSINVGQPGGRVVASNVPLRMLLMLTYQLPSSRILGWPGWADSAHFDIEARAEGSPPPEQKRLMLQALLADRFKLVAHHETRELAVYALVVAKPGHLGPQLIPHPAGDACSDASNGPTSSPADAAKPAIPCGGISVGAVTGGMRFAGKKLTIEQFLKLLGGANQMIDRPLIDRTGLTGAFDLTLEFAPLQPAVNTDASDPAAPPSIFTAVQEQLGLKLEPQKGPVDVLVIDHIEEPSPN